MSLNAKASKAVKSRDLAVFAVIFSCTFAALYVMTVLGAGVDGITPISPASGTWSSGDSGTIAFTFSYTGDNATSSCMLFLNGTETASNATTPNATVTVLYSNASLSEGSYSWLVGCEDATVNSSTWTLNIDRSAPDLSFVSPTLDNESYTANVSWIYVNVTGYEPLGGCLIENYTENISMTVTDQSCWYNYTDQANLTNAIFRVYANDSAGNLNVTEWRNITVNLTGISDCTPSLTNITWIHEGNTTPVNHANISCNASDIITLNWSWTEWNWTVEWDTNACGGDNTTYYDNVTWYNYSYEACDYDVIPPDISDVGNSTIYAIRAYVSWNTSEDANASVMLGTNESALSVNASSASLLSFRNLSVQYLAKNTTYYYNVTSCDPSGNCNTTGTYSFTTPECDSSWIEGSWSSCSSSSQSMTRTDSKQCQYPFEINETRPCDSGSSGNRRSSGGGAAPPPAGISSRPQLVPGIGIINNTKLQNAIESILDKGELSSAARENLLRISGSITDDTTAWRNMTYSGGKTRLQTRLRYTGTEGAKNFMVYEELPKVFAARARDVTITCPGASVMVVEEDPAWLFNYPEVSPQQELIITYEVSGTKSPTVPNLTQTEIYAETLFSAAQGSRQDQAVNCTPGVRRCSGADLQVCMPQGVGWAVLESCTYGCDADMRACLQSSQKAETEAQPDISFAVIASAVFAAFVLAGLAMRRMRRKEGSGIGGHQDSPNGLQGASNRNSF